MQPHQRWVEGKDNLLQPDRDALPSASQDTAAQDAVGCLCCEGTVQTHVHLGVHQDPRDLFC